ncbi:Hsp70 family protein [Rhodococcoides corynebacterioides]|uniref:Hsp70 family protein n=1 Tax=Rhodococcoides corynebacterioides TaxID=53972 RepID=UPI000B04A620|nr:Hsp70 family protein [Rhodococcus corynebacterioides]
MPHTNTRPDPADRPATTLGVSAGSEVVCCAVLTTTDTGREVFDYRTLTVDGLRADPAELVTTSLALATDHLLRDGAAERPRVGVAHRPSSRTRPLLAALRRHDHALTADNLVTDTDAALCWLRHTGEVARFGHVLLVDVGASGTSVSVVDQTDGTVRASTRTDVMSGRVVERALAATVESRLPTVHMLDRALVAARLTTAKEQLSSAESSSVDLPGGETVTVTRADLDDALAAPLRAFRSAITDLVGTAIVLHGESARPDAAAVIGGGAFVPAVVDAVADAVDVPLVTTTEPDAAVAKGAALLARTLAHPARSTAPSTSGVRTAGAVAAACAVLAVVLAYGVQALTPIDDPTVTASAATDLTDEAAVTTTTTVDALPAPPPALTGGWDDPGAAAAPPTSRFDYTPLPTTTYDYTAPRPRPSTPAPATSTSTETTGTPPPTPTTPSLRPAPDLPIIEIPGLPGLPPWWATPPSTAPVDPTPANPAPSSSAPTAVTTLPAVPDVVTTVPVPQPNTATVPPATSESPPAP